ncbi:MAG TPA: D-arabinono-1,4-lactone oxidase [Ktedonobacteraceae bacterium]|nr:D-arabinono-1,4-lactone oxidase [Ktedonobacteraceae bacterium]
MAPLPERRWHNWSGSVACRPQQIAQPTSIEGLVQIIRACSKDNQHVRVVGSGHSFTPLVQTDDVLLSLHHMRGIEEIDTERGTVTVLAGTPLKMLGEVLHTHGLAQENLGGIDAQTIAGAISTGTHGTGRRSGTLSAQVAGLTLVTASGEVLECSEDHNRDLFKAAQVSLGTLGVIVRVKLRVVPAKRLHFRSQRERFGSCLTNFEHYNQENSHFEIFWFPHTSWVQVKFLNETNLPVSKRSIRGDFNKVVLENGMYWLLSECCRLLPPLSRTVSALSTMAIMPVNEVNYSQRAYVAPRVVRVQAMEYAIPIEDAQAALREIEACIRQHRFQVHCPLGCRFVRADDIWLSPAYQRDSAYIAVHMYRGMAYQSYFQHIEEILQHYQGRPHWGKMHTLDAARLATLYPHWHDFRRIRAALDPQGLFLNDYLRQLLDADGPVPPGPAHSEREAITGRDAG